MAIKISTQTSEVIKTIYRKYTSKFGELWSPTQQHLWIWRRSKVKVTAWCLLKGLVTEEMSQFKVFVTDRQTEITDGQTNEFECPPLSRKAGGGGGNKTTGQSRLSFARLEASSGPKTEVVPTNNQRGRGSGSRLLWGGLDKSRHIVPTALLVRMRCFRIYLYKAVGGPSAWPIVLSIVTGSYFWCRRRLTFLSPTRRGV